MKAIHQLLILMLFFGAAKAAEKPKHQMERFTRDVEIKKPTKIKIVNHYGDIRIRKADDDLFIYHGVAQSQPSQKVTLDFQQQDGEITAIVNYSDPEKTNHTDRFDLALIVPELASLDIEIEGGELTTKGLNSAVKVRSTNSDIQVKTPKAVDLFSKNGAIEWTVNSLKDKSESNIQTYKGAVTIFYLENMPGFEIITGNHVASNSSKLLMSQKKIDRLKQYGDKDSAHQIKIKTDLGPITLIDLAF